MILQGNALYLPFKDLSVHCVVTSPPYWGLRDYGLPPLIWGGEPGCEHEWGGSWRKGMSGGVGAGTLQGTQQGAMKGGDVRFESSSAFCSRCSAWSGSLGLEPTPELYVQHLVAVFREVRRVLRDDGTLWLNLGDSYAAGKPKTYNSNGYDDPGWTNEQSRRPSPGLKPKDLVGIPWRIAFALQADGWWLRSDIVWAKPNPMPESVTDRPTKAHELVFLLSKSSKYYYDAEAVREPSVDPPGVSRGGALARFGPDEKLIAANAHRGNTIPVSTGFRNLRSVWWIATQPYPESHFAVFPEALVRPCILAGTSERGVCPTCGAPWERVVEKETAREHGGTRDMTKTPLNVVRAGWRNGGPESHTLAWRPTCDHGGEPVPATVLDPFAGSGTVVMVAEKLGRRGAGIELSRAYIGLARKRLEQAPLL